MSAAWFSLVTCHTRFGSVTTRRTASRKKSSSVSTSTSMPAPDGAGAMVLTGPACRLCAALCFTARLRKSLFEADNQLGRMAAPVDRDHERTDIGRRHGMLRRAADDARHGDHELAAEITARVAGNLVRDLAGEIAHVLVRHLGLAEAHQQHRQHR